jgi:hypothetical protein
MLTRACRVVVLVALACGLGITPAWAQVLTPPPAVQVEKPPPSPGGQFVWIAGHWTPQGGRWVWVAGRWVEAQGAWIPGRYQQTAQGWIYVEGRWKR